MLILCSSGKLMNSWNKALITLTLMLDNLLLTLMGGEH